MTRGLTKQREQRRQARNQIQSLTVASACSNKSSQTELHGTSKKQRDKCCFLAKPTKELL